MPAAGQAETLAAKEMPGKDKKTMAKIFQLKLISAICAAMVTVGIFGFGSFALAQTPTGGIEVGYERTPLFDDANLAPGDSVSRAVTVKNSDSAPRAVSMQFYDTDKGGFGLLGQNLASQFSFEIKKNGASVYSEKLDAAFDESEIAMNSSLAAGADEKYDFILSFDTAAGNDYQDKQLSFSICVGFAGDNFCVSDSEEESQNSGGGMTLTSISGGGIGGDRAVVPLKYFDYEVKTYCLGDGTAMAMFSWKTDAPATGRALHAPANSAKFDPALPDFGYQATKWETKPVTEHTAFAFGLFPVQTYDWRLDMTAANSRRVTTQSLGTFTAPACVLGASDEKDIIEDVMGVSTGVLGEMTDEEIKRFMADLRAQNQNSDDDQSGNKIAVATFAPAALAASNAPAPASSQNSANNSGALIAFALFVVAVFAGRFLAKHLTR